VERPRPDPEGPRIEMEANGPYIVYGRETHDRFAELLATLQ
jgi:hypothetical protein